MQVAEIQSQISTDSASTVGTQSAISFAIEYALKQQSDPVKPAEPQPDVTGPSIKTTIQRRYDAHTKVQPKGVLQEYRNADAETVTHSFSSTFPHIGIRALPNALQPNFREWLVHAVAEREKSRPQMHPQAHGNGNLSQAALMWPAVGQRKPAKHSNLAQSFSSFEHLHSGYERERMLNRIDYVRSCAARVGTQDFVVRSVPQAPKSAPAFTEFEYEETPYNALDMSRKEYAHWKRDNILHGPMYSGGHVEQTNILKGRLRECMRTLSKDLMKDWPDSFLQVFEDPKGCIVVSFDKEKAMLEGNVTAFMNRLAVDHPLISEFHLFRDSNLWGMEDSSSPSVFYIFWPHWAHHRATVSEPLAGPIPQFNKPMQEWNPATVSIREPFGLRTACGLLLPQCVGAYDHSMKL